MLTTLVLFAAIAFFAAVYGARNPMTVWTVKKNLKTLWTKVVKFYKFARAYLTTAK